ncbi:MAG: molybdopterin-synthase adenylyltransferase MoeB [Methanosarcinaceae archaeon]|nr:molybdopterin-synthase adenylyltransferase MoeB [Methanosarcinaceae archaeon]MDD4331443.1 molybdopterin-synthase adenylyltransferase MoeB [Methanosarcinaceae archaeon]MDD4750035.1 molybdopterin-synthase adenylyltransferase MoeB [Methanosarcinaceae archaeon]
MSKNMSEKQSLIIPKKGSEIIFKDPRKNASNRNLEKLSEKQHARYARHLVLPEIGEEGQTRLLASRILCIGAGGLGSPVISYLAAAGVGTLGIADGDCVDCSNLQRQIIHGGKLGVSKVKSAEEFVRKLNPEVRVEPFAEKVNPKNILHLVKAYDLVVDCSDNFETRFLVNDACVLLKKPLCHGSIYRFEGQAMTILPEEGPCYRCLFTRPPKTEKKPGDEGVLGVLPGVIGAIQATEALKCLLGIGKTLKGRLLYYDALYMSFKEINVQKSPECPVCGKNARITSIVPENY